MIKIEEDFYFSTPIYRSSIMEYVDTCLKVFNDKINYITSQNGFVLDEFYPVIMTDNLFHETLHDFYSLVNQNAWNILDSQGFDLTNFVTVTKSAWGQQHHKHSNMDYHYHPESVLNAFYFLEVPENSTQLCFVDPRLPRAFDYSLPHKTNQELTLASSRVYYTPKAGDLFFTNSWLPHSFTKNRSDKPFKFIHINIDCELINQQ